MDEAQSLMFEVPWLFKRMPDIVDDLKTESSVMQAATTRECLPYLSGQKNFERNSYGVPKLRREGHVEFLQSWLGDLEPDFVSLDAGRPWIVYWSISGLGMLGYDMKQFKDGVVANVEQCQHPEGGIAGGFGHAAHLATTYATLLSLVSVGDESALDCVNRKTMWQWLGKMKQLDGGFTMCHGGEEDARGAFCAVIILSLLNLPLELPSDSPARVKGDETFLTGLPEWISRCQTYEGGISASPGTEAHGAYTFCALGALCVMGAPYEMINRYLDLDALVSWLTSRQYAPEGGLAGRANKLVDGCYSHWIGGCWALVEAAVRGPDSDGLLGQPSLWHREGLTRYILCCAQADKGGLRDKPSKHPDGYHSCYNLAGLSAAQNVYIFDRSLIGTDDPIQGNGLTAPFKWTNQPFIDVPCEEGDRVSPYHPVFVVPLGKAEAARRYFASKGGF
ncbi:terpenoid cyclases/Protein prenyltransferase [Aulographum hederae CBS 113979]|uniref:Protein farnesyltransferase subunit beta n=1 Tax=Aulographum hederae CBS 113979 TaxID=1176131 RepID=A0A6G1HFL3_9PEZI|nr:terpenoid cyclases/Protein prenyltransferase [Aulographum hederae CBS 113979]